MAKRTHCPRVAIIVAVLLFLVLPPASYARALTDDDLVQVRYEQKLNAHIAFDIKFRDERGQPVTLGNYFGQRPVILFLGYYNCPMLCTLTLNGMVQCLQDLKPSAGEGFEVVCISINPNETTALAAAKKANYTRLYGRPGAEAGWHFLTGNDDTIHQLAGQVGFHYAYDDSARQYAHPSGFVVLAPDGRISKYFFGVKYSSTELAAALRDAQAGKAGSPVDQFFLLCFHYSPLTGKYGNLVMWIVRAGGVATVLGLAGLVASGFPRRRKRKGVLP